MFAGLITQSATAIQRDASFYESLVMPGGAHGSLKRARGAMFPGGFGALKRRLNRVPSLGEAYSPLSGEIVALAVRPCGGRSNRGGDRQIPLLRNCSSPVKLKDTKHLYVSFDTRPLSC
jgi:hypothetical protein